MKDFEKFISEITRVISKIRHTNSLSDLLNSVLNQLCRSYNSDGGIIIIHDMDSKIFDFALKGIELDLDKQLYKNHPIEFFQNNCPIINRERSYLKLNGLDRDSVEESRHFVTH